MLVPTADLGNEVRSDSSSGAAFFARDGWVVGRGMLPVDVVRDVRRPVVDLLIGRGFVEASSASQDRFRWIGDPSALDDLDLKSLNANKPLVEPGHARRCIEHLWGKPATLWTNTAVFLNLPNSAFDTDPYRSNPHRDGWQPLGYGEPQDHFNFWIPLTEFGELDGSLALLPGSHESDDEAEPIKGFRTAAGRTITAYGFRPERYAGRWRSTRFDVGDALLFRPDLVHAATVNRSADVRIALVVRGQDARTPLPPAAGFSPDRTQEPGPLESCVLALFALGPLRPYDVWKECAPHGRMGRYRPLPQDLVTRAVEALRARGLLEPFRDADDREFLRATDAGARATDDWLQRPVLTPDHLSFELPLKLELSCARGLDPTVFVGAQRAALATAVPAGDSGLYAVWRQSLLTAASHLLDAVSSGDGVRSSGTA